MIDEQLIKDLESLKYEDLINIIKFVHEKIDKWYSYQAERAVKGGDDNA